MAVLLPNAISTVIVNRSIASSGFPAQASGELNDQNFEVSSRYEDAKSSAALAAACLAARTAEFEPMLAGDVHGRVEDKTHML